jgi:hypothetical protein
VKNLAAIALLLLAACAGRPRNSANLAAPEASSCGDARVVEVNNTTRGSIDILTTLTGSATSTVVGSLGGGSIATLTLPPGSTGYVWAQTSGSLVEMSNAPLKNVRIRVRCA